MLKQRVVTALILLVLFLGALFGLPSWVWLVFSASIGGLAAWEWAGLAGATRLGRLSYGCGFCVVGLWLAYIGGLHLDAVANSGYLALLYGVNVLFWLSIAPAWLARKWRPTTPVLLLVGLLVLLPSVLALANLRQLGAAVLLAVLVIVWLADIGAYFTGRAFGQHKLAPSISPGKTWEGAIGALVTVVFSGLAMLAGAWWGREIGWLAWGGVALFLALLTILSIEGDLFESLLKRQAGVKDSGNLLPGHGGVLDRIDSLTACLSLMALLALLRFHFGWHS